MGVNARCDAVIERYEQDNKECENDCSVDPPGAYLAEF